MSHAMEAQRDAADAAPAASAKRERDAEQLVADIADRHFGERPKRLRRCHGGLTNSVYAFSVSQGQFIVRTHGNATKISDYLKERWAMDAARAVGVPTPRVLEVGNFDDGRPYMISDHVGGVDGRIAGDRLQLVESLGRCAARLHTVRTQGCGPVFDWSGNQLSRHGSWASWLADGFNVERRIGVLVRQRLIDPPQAAALRRTAADVSRRRGPARLQHGDLRLKNVIADADNGKLLALIDWDTALSAPTPAWDVSLALHDLGIDEQEAFLAGYGMTPRAYRSALPGIRFFNVLNYAQPAEAAAARRDRACLDRYRLRLQGGSDLYGL